MRAKELRDFLKNIPDDTEILIRCQVHQHPAMGAKETVNVSSLTPNINKTRHQIMFNPEKTVRLLSFQPDLDDMVRCSDCIRASRISACRKKGKECEGCSVVCPCKECGHFDIETEQPFSSRPKYEKDLSSKKNPYN